MLFTPPPPAPGAPPRVTRREQFRLIVLAFAALAVTGAIAVSWAASRRPSAPAPAGATAPGGGEGSGPAEIAVAPLFPEEEAREVEALLVEGLRGFTGIRDGEVADDAASFRYLVQEVTRNYRVLNLRPEGFQRPGDLAAILRDPGLHRGRLLEVTGELLALERHPPPEGDALVQQLRRGVLRDGAGNLFSFTRPILNPLEPDAVERAGAWARVRGIFYRVVPVPDPAAPTTLRPSVHLVLTESPLADYPPVTVREIAPEWYAEVRDATHAEAAVRDEPPFYLLLNMLSHLGPEGFEAWGRAQQGRAPNLRVWPPEDFSGRARDLIQAPANHRFRPITYTGILKRPQWLYDLKPNPGNVERLWVAFLVSDDLVPVWVYSTRSFVDMGFRDGDRVRVEGLFLKRVVYTPAGGKEPLRAPVMLFARGAAAPVPDAVVSRDVVLVIAAVAGLLLLALLVAVVQSRREGRADAEWHRRRAARKRGRATKGAGAAPAAPGGDPGAA